MEAKELRERQIELNKKTLITMLNNLDHVSDMDSMTQGIINLLGIYSKAIISTETDLNMCLMQNGIQTISLSDPEE